VALSVISRLKQLSTVGVDAVTGVYRFTFDSVSLSDGIQFTTIVIGFFSISEILIMLEKTSIGQKALGQGKRSLFNLKEFSFTIGSTIRSSFLGFIVGILPGAGATIASAMAYTSERKLAGKDSKFGDGDLRGIAAPEAANNASACGSFIPMLTLGVPGSGTTAVMLGALTLYNITPGPQLFTEQPTIVWGLIASLFIASVLLLLMNISNSMTFLIINDSGFLKRFFNCFSSIRNNLNSPVIPKLHHSIIF